MAPSAIQVKAFINRNIVSIVMVSGLIFVHWSWFKLQEIRYIREGQLDKSRSPILEVNITNLTPILVIM